MGDCRGEGKKVGHEIKATYTFGKNRTWKDFVKNERPEGADYHDICIEDDGEKMLVTL